MFDVKQSEKLKGQRAQQRKLKEDNITSNVFISELAILSGQPANVILDVYYALVVYMKNHLMHDKRCNLKGIGVFSIKTHKGHGVVKNLKSGADAVDHIEDYNVIKYKPHQYFKNLIFGVDNSENE